MKISKKILPCISAIVLVFVTERAFSQCVMSNNSTNNTISGPVTQLFTTTCAGDLNYIEVMPAVAHTGFEISVYSSCSGGVALGTGCVPAGSANQIVRASFNNIVLQSTTAYYFRITRPDLSFKYDDRSFNPSGSLCTSGCNCANSNPRWSLFFVARIGGTNTCVLPTTPVIAATNTSIACGESTTLSIASGQLNSATGWKWYKGSCGGTLVGQGNAVTVSPAQPTTYYVRAEGCCAGNSSCASIAIDVQATWTGAANNDWNIAANWCGNTVPLPTQDVLIKNGQAVVISSGTATVKNLVISNGAVFGMTGGTLKVYESIQNNNTGNLVMSGGTIDYCKNGNQFINNTIHYWLLQTSGSGTKTVSGNLVVNGTP